MPLQSKIIDLDSLTERSRTGQSSLLDTHNIDEQANTSSATEVKKSNRKRRAKKKKQKKRQQQKEHGLEPQQEPGQEAIAVPEDTSHPLLNHPRGQEPPQVDHESDTTSTESPQKETTAIIQQSSGNDQADEARPFSLGSCESATGINNPTSLSLPGSSPTLKQRTAIVSGSTMFTPAPQYFKRPLPSESSASRSTKITFSQHEAESVTDTHIETTDSAEGLALFSRMDSDSEDLQQEGNTNYDYEREFEEDVARLTEEKTEYEDTGIDPAMAAASRQQEDLSEQNQALFMRYQHAIMKCGHMQTELAAQEKSRQNAEEAFQQQIDGLKKQLRDLKTLIEMLKRKEEEQRELCEEAVKKMNKYIELATTQKKRADHCMAEVLRLQSDLEDVSNMLTETKEENDTLEHQCTVLEHRYKRLAEEQKQYGDQQDTTDKICALTDEILRLTVENQTLKSFAESHYLTSTQVSREQTPSPQREQRPSLLEEFRNAGIVLDSQPGGQSSNTTSRSVSPSERPQNDEYPSQGNEATNESNSQSISLGSEPAIERLDFDTPPSTQLQQQGPLPPNTVPSEHTSRLFMELSMIRGLILDLNNHLQRSADQLQQILGFHHNQQLFIQRLYFQELAHRQRRRQRGRVARRPGSPLNIGWELPFCTLGVVVLFAVVDVPKFAATVQKLPSLMLKLVLNMSGLDIVPA